MYSPEHIAKVCIFVFVHNNTNMFSSYFCILIDIHQYYLHKSISFLLHLT